MIVYLVVIESKSHVQVLYEDKVWTSYKESLACYVRATNYADSFQNIVRVQLVKFSTASGISLKDYAKG